MVITIIMTYIYINVCKNSNLTLRLKQQRILFFVPHFFVLYTAQFA